MCSCNEKWMSQAPPVMLERFFYSTGQKLRSSDLNALLAVAEARRLWHNRAVHNVFGLSDGLDVFAMNDAKLNLIGVGILPGLAYDCTGAPLLLQSDAKVPVPAGVPASVTECLLLARRQQPNSLGCSCSPRIRCCLGEKIQTGEWVEFVWKDAASVGPRDGVPLARISYPMSQSSPAKKRSTRKLAQTPKLGPTLDVNFEPPRIRPIQRSHIAADRTLPGATDWQQGSFLGYTPATGQFPLDWQAVTVSVDTSAAGFKEVPCYFAQIGGSLLDEAGLEWLPAAFPYITDEKANSFTFGFWIPAFPQETLRAAVFTHQNFDSQVGSVIGFDNFLAFARRQKLFVTWLGCEMPPQPVPIRRAELSKMFCGCGTAQPMF
jgi:hypothetical protein